MCEVYLPDAEWVPPEDFIVICDRLRVNTRQLCGAALTETQRAAMAFVRANRLGLQLILNNCQHGIVLYFPRGPLNAASLDSSVAADAPWCLLEAPLHPRPPLMQFEKTVLMLDWLTFSSACRNTHPGARFAVDEPEPNHLICNACNCRLYPERFALLESAASAAIWDRAATQNGRAIAPPVLVDELIRATQIRARADELRPGSPYKRRRQKIYLTPQDSQSDAADLVRDSLADFTSPAPAPVTATPPTATELAELAFHPRIEMALPRLEEALHWLAPGPDQAPCWPLSFLKHAPNLDVYFSGGAFVARLDREHACVQLTGRCDLLLGPDVQVTLERESSGPVYAETYRCVPGSFVTDEMIGGTKLTLTAPHTHLRILCDQICVTLRASEPLHGVAIAARLSSLQTTARFTSIRPRALRAYTFGEIRRCATNRLTRPCINRLAPTILQGSQLWHRLQTDLRRNMQCVDAFLDAVARDEMPMEVQGAYSALCRPSDAHRAYLKDYLEGRESFSMRADPRRPWVYLCGGRCDAPLFAYGLRAGEVLFVQLPELERLVCSRHTALSLDDCLSSQFDANKPAKAPLDVAFGYTCDAAALPGVAAEVWDRARIAANFITPEDACALTHHNRLKVKILDHIHEISAPALAPPSPCMSEEHLHVPSMRSVSDALAGPSHLLTAYS